MLVVLVFGHEGVELGAGWCWAGHGWVFGDVVKEGRGGEMCAMLRRGRGFGRERVCTDSSAERCMVLVDVSTGD